MCAFRVLLVEDNAPFRGSIRDMLRTNFPSMDIAEASNGAEALSQIELGLPGLIFMDIRLPGESGLQLTKKIKSSHPDIVIAILTNHDLPEYRRAAFENGANYFLSKDSFSPEDILGLIQSVLPTKVPD